MSVLVSILPFIVCLFWFVFFIIRWNVLVSHVKALTIFAAICTILYGCHALFFNGFSTLLSESVWTFCSLACYPFYLLYLIRITSSRPFQWSRLHVLLPAFVVSILSYTINRPWVDLLRQVTFLIAIVVTCVYGLISLVRFERSMKENYADLSVRSTQSIQTLLICFVLTSLFSAIFNIIGKNIFVNETLLLAIPSVLFSTMLFLLFYIGNKYTFSNETMVNELSEEEGVCLDQSENIDILGARLHILMDEQHLFLRHDLKLTDLAKEVGTCRTYLSSYLNNQLKISFSDYINRRRVEYAKQLLKSHPDMSAEELSLRSGFSSVTTFKRNQDKFA